MRFIDLSQLFNFPATYRPPLNFTTNYCPWSSPSFIRDYFGILMDTPKLAITIIIIFRMQERQHRSTGRSSDTIASFLLKTYEILQHPENKKIISWDKDDVGFIVLDMVSFTRQILPKYFRHSNFSSFVRQLNMYDFHKVKQDNDMLVFKNPLFCRGEHQKLRFIKRKAAKKISGFHRRLYNNDRADQQKVSSTFKWLKKAVQSQVTHSCIFLEKSIDLVTENNQANALKQAKLQQLQKAEQDSRLDLLYQFRQDCQSQLSRTIKWLDQNLQIFKRKLKAAGNYSNQINQSKKEEEDQIKQSQPRSLPQLNLC